MGCSYRLGEATMIGRAVMLAALVVATPALAEETYRLVHAIGNAERIVAIRLSKAECESRKRELKAVAASLGTGGSITCLPESFFK